MAATNATASSEDRSGPSRATAWSTITRLSLRLYCSLSKLATTLATVAGSALKVGKTVRQCSLSYMCTLSAQEYLCYHAARNTHLRFSNLGLAVTSRCLAVLLLLLLLALFASAFACCYLLETWCLFWFMRYK